jgi:predicted DNA-binding transcriptional regulator AlpA
VKHAKKQTPEEKQTPAEENSPSGGKGRVRARLPMIPLSMDGVWRTGHVLAATGWSHGTLYNRIRDKKWPKPVKEGGPDGLNGWTTSVVRKALKKLGYEV